MCCAKAIDAISGCLNENVMLGGGKGNNILHLTSSLQLSSVAQSCLTLCDPHRLQHARLDERHANQSPVLGVIFRD